MNDLPAQILDIARTPLDRSFAGLQKAADDICGTVDRLLRDNKRLRGELQMLYQTLGQIRVENAILRAKVRNLGGDVDPTAGIVGSDHEPLGLVLPRPSDRRARRCRVARVQGEVMTWLARFRRWRAIRKQERHLRRLRDMRVILNKPHHTTVRGSTEAAGKVY